MSTPQKDNKRASKPGGSPPQAKAKAEKSSEMVGVDDDIVVQANAPPLWFVAYEERLEKRLSTNFGDLAVKLDDVKAIAQSAKQESQMALNIAKTNDVAVKELTKEMSELRKRLEEPVFSNSGNGKPITSKEEQDDNREFEVIAHGFEKDSDAEDVEKILNDLIKEMKLESRVSKVFTFSDPTSIGVIRFKTVPSKYGFYKQLCNHVAKSKGGNMLDFENNKTLEEREQEKHLGYTKHILIDRGMAKPESVKIFWKDQRVEVDCVKVAWLGADGEYNVSGVAVQIKDEVLKMVKNFADKRRGARSSD